MTARTTFGAIAFLITGIIVGLILSPVVSDTKEQIALIVLGNVLAWPMIVLQYFFGTTQSSAEKTQLLADRGNQALDLTVEAP